MTSVFMMTAMMMTGITVDWHSRLWTCDQGGLKIFSRWALVHIIVLLVTKKYTFLGLSKVRFEKEFKIIFITQIILHLSDTISFIFP